MEFNNPIVGEEELIRSAIRSQNYVAGTSGWRIAADGTAEFTSVIVSSEGSGTRIRIEAGQIILEDSPGGTLWWQVALGSSGYGAYSYSQLGDSAQLAHSQASLEWMADEVDTNNKPRIIYQGPFFTFPHRLVFRSGLQNTATPGGITMTMQNVADRNTEQPWVDFVSNHATNDASFRIEGVDQGAGLKDFQAITANTALVTTTETVGITSSSVTFRKDRAYKIHVHGLLQSSAANDVVRSRTRRTGVAGTILMDTMNTVFINTANTNEIFDYSQIVVNTSGADISDVLVVTYHRIAGAGNVRIAADATNPAWIEIVDCGIAADYPSARAL